MSRILQEVLKTDKRVHLATDTYLDDILVNEDVATAEEVSRHLRNFGLEAKPAEALQGSLVSGCSVLRLVN